MKKRLFFFPLFASALAFSAFVRSDGSEAVRAVQIVSLIATGMGLGVALAHLKFVLDARSPK
ncbi:MAG: hypothetical protein WAQ52_11350 [Terriglobales bacterium]